MPCQWCAKCLRFLAGARECRDCFFACLLAGAPLCLSLCAAWLAAACLGSGRNQTHDSAVGYDVRLAPRLAGPTCKREGLLLGWPGAAASCIACL